MPIYIIKEPKKNNYCKSTKYYKKDEKVFTFFFTLSCITLPRFLIILTYKISHTPTLSLGKRVAL